MIVIDMPSLATRGIGPANRTPMSLRAEHFLPLLSREFDLV